MNHKKYKLKPGRHQFVPSSHAAHSNDNLSDAEAEWYLEKYPHIAYLFEVTSENNQDDPACRVSVEVPQSQHAESLESSTEIGEIEN